MKIPVQFLLASSLVFFACQKGNGKDLDKKIKAAIVTYRTDTAEMGRVLTIDSLVILSVDSLTKTDFALKSADRFKKHIYWITKDIAYAQQGIDIQKELTTELFKSDTASYNHNKQMLSKYQEQLNISSGMLHAAQNSLDSCMGASKGADASEFAGYLVTVYSEMHDEEQTNKIEEQYLITKEMQARSYQNWETLLKKYKDVADRPEPVLDTHTQD